MTEKEVNEEFKSEVIPVVTILQGYVARILYELTGKALGTLGPTGIGGDREVFHINDALANLKMAGIGIGMILEHLDEQYEEQCSKKD